LEYQSRQSFWLLENENQAPLSTIDPSLRDFEAVREEMLKEDGRGIYAFIDEKFERRTRRRTRSLRVSRA
jgi:hypothetical protein